MSDTLDTKSLTDWMDKEGLGEGPITDLHSLTGGTQNVLIKFSKGGRTYVLRKGPEHLRSRSNDIMRREMRVLKALADTEVPHPNLIAACPDESILRGAAFYLMDPIAGVNPTVALAPVHANSPETRHAMGLNAVDALASLGLVDYVGVGLGDFGHPEGFLERQVLRWLSELEGYGRHLGYPGQAIPGLEVIAGWLEANQPHSFQAGLLHGDYHLANLMYQCDGPGVAAIVDWEMCTIGDPLLDLGWLITTWPGVHDLGVAGALGEAGGLPTTHQLLARYREQSSRDLSSIAWYEVLACFKLGIILEGTYARACAGKAPREVGDRLHATAVQLFDHAQQRIAED